MEPVISLRDVGIRFRVARHTHVGRTPKLFGSRKSLFWGLRETSLEVARGEAVGLIGPSGAGKTTLLRTVAGVYVPDEGTVEVRGRVGTLLSLSAGLIPQLSGWENIALGGVLLGLTRARTREVMPRIAEFSGLGRFLEATVHTYSEGMKARLGFSIAAFTDPDVLVLDEVLAVGDEEFRERSFGVLEEFVRTGRPVLAASHELDRLAKLCTRFVRMDRGRIVETGDPETVVRHYLELHGRPREEAASPGTR